MSQSRFANEVAPLPNQLDAAANSARRRLMEKGFVVGAGLTRSYAGAISVMAKQPHIEEMCPRDARTRFATEETTADWLGKGGGRNVFLLLKNAGSTGLRLAGYGWTGAESNPVVPGGETTFAVRIGNEGRGQRAASDFSRLIIAGSAALYGTKRTWLETYQGNSSAVGAYLSAGFEPFIDHDGQPVTKITARPTLHEPGTIINGQEVYLDQSGDTPKNMVADVRCYMVYPDEPSCA